MEIAELISLDAILRRARARVLRRMQDFGPRHRLTIQATLLSISIRDMKENIVNA